MVYKLLAVSKFPLSGVNIGDYVQALASSQYYPQVDGFIDRDEELKCYDEEPCKVIMNGWYMHNPMNWPPSDKIKPLFVAFHLNSTVKKEMLSFDSISYLKSHEPIGCRDLNTLEILKENGIDAYFSGCMTLTLGKKYRSNKRENATYIVDPQLSCSLGLENIGKALWELIRHPRDIYNLFTNQSLVLHRGRNILSKLLKTALFYRGYTRTFGRKLVMESIYICQESDYYRTQFKSEEARLREAERLIQLYAKAKLVITSRIHCALPCLGLETPVIYLQKAQDSEESLCRMKGLQELFNIIKVDNGILTPMFDTTQPITVQNFPINKDSWRKYAEELDKKCSDFIKL